MMNRTAIELEKTGLDPNKGPICPDCLVHAVLFESAEIYNGQDFGKMWVCRNYPTCDSYVGVHKHGKYQNYPLGRLANLGLRKAKQWAHGKFDLLWKNKLMTRDESYRWLQEQMKLDPLDAHIGEMDVAQCFAVRELADAFINNYFADKDDLFTDYGTYF